MASRNKKEKDIYDASVRKLNEIQKKFAKVEAAHASTSMMLRVNKESTLTIRSQEKHEIEIEERDARSEIGSYENNGGDGREEGLVSASDDGESKSKDYHYPLRPDCNYYSPTDCKFNHPLIDKNQTKETEKKIEENKERRRRRRRKPTNETKKKKEENMDMHGPVEYKQPSKETQEKKEKHVEMHGPIDCKPTKETKKKKEENMDMHGPVEYKPSKETKEKKEKHVEMHGPIDCKPTMETKKKKEKNMDVHGPVEGKCHMSSAGCKHGKACKFNHGVGKNVKTPVIEYNFVGLPIRPGEKKCPYYMSKGFCQNGRTCRLHHPDPVADETGLI
ncbi:hypothetical protein E3N88_39444 [Mikania micrantha]|uniref:C3H1-type domain-containing protein n=1 Tax=Mikania micrantha TaxID=192012 RepID=A0A5N6LX01_9ASTR|nr:hypothetical protein E3N88_39444 [Mikania micrantha]